MKTNKNMIAFFAILTVVSVASIIVFPKLLKKNKANLWEDEREADEFLNQVKNYLNETRPFEN